MDPVHCNMAHLFVELLKDSLNEYAYAAEIAGVNYKLENTMYGIYVSDHSYFDKVMTKFMINNRTDAQKTDVNLLSFSFPEPMCLLVSKRHTGSGNEIGVVCDKYVSLLGRTVNGSYFFAKKSQS